MMAEDGQSFNAELMEVLTSVEIGITTKKVLGSSLDYSQLLCKESILKPTNWEFGMKNPKGMHRYAKYREFEVSNASRQYLLHVSKHSGTDSY